MAENFRRTDPRYDRALDVEIMVDGKKVPGTSRNLSLGGILVDVSGPPLAVQTTVQVRFRVPTQPELIDVTGEVRWIVRAEADGPSGMGIRFHGLRARDVWALNRFFLS